MILPLRFAGSSISCALPPARPFSRRTGRSRYRRKASVHEGRRTAHPVIRGGIRRVSAAGPGGGVAGDLPRERMGIAKGTSADRNGDLFPTGVLPDQQEPGDVEVRDDPSRRAAGEAGGRSAYGIRPRPGHGREHRDAVDGTSRLAADDAIPSADGFRRNRGIPRGERLPSPADDRNVPSWAWPDRGSPCSCSFSTAHIRSPRSATPRTCCRARRGAPRLPCNRSGTGSSPPIRRIAS
jgi:hypothetical protein